MILRRLFALFTLSAFWFAFGTQVVAWSLGATTLALLLLCMGVVIGAVTNHYYVASVYCDEYSYTAKHDGRTTRGIRRHFPLTHRLLGEDLE